MLRTTKVSVSHHSYLYSWSLCLTTHLCTTGVSVSHHSSLYISVQLDWSLSVSPLISVQLWTHLCTTGVSVFHHSSLYHCVSPLISVQLESLSRYSSLYRSWSLCVSPLISVQLCLTTHLCTTGISVSALISVQLESLFHTIHLCTTGVSVSHHSVISVQLESVTALSSVRLKFLSHC